MPEFYIGDPQESLDIGKRIINVIGEIQDSNIRKRFENELRQALQLVKDWCEFKKSGAKDFDKWYLDFGRNYQRTKTYYYNAKASKE